MDDHSVKVQLTPKSEAEQQTAIIEGKTSVPLRTFVKLVYERKLGNLLKTEGEEPIILASDLLTDLASAPHDSRQNQAKLTLVTLGCGFLLGVFCFSLVEIVLPLININLTREHYGAFIGILLILVFLVMTLEKMRRRKKDDKVTEAMERLTSLISK